MLIAEPCQSIGIHYQLDALVHPAIGAILLESTAMQELIGLDNALLSLGHWHTVIQTDHEQGLLDCLHRVRIASRTTQSQIGLGPVASIVVG